MLLLLMRMRWLRGCVDLASHGDRVRRVSGHGDVRQVRRDSGVDVGDGRPAAGGRCRQQAFITGSDQRRRPGRPAQRPSHRRDHHQTQTRRTLSCLPGRPGWMEPGCSGAGTASPDFFRQGGRVPHSPHLFGLKFVQKLVHCCSWLLTETQYKIISVLSKSCFGRPPTFFRTTPLGWSNVFGDF